TENLFARDLGFQNGCESLVDTIVAGRVRWIDLGRAGRRFFTIMAGVGFDADVVQRVARWRQRRRSLPRGTRLSYVRPILAALRYPPPGLVDIVADGIAVRCTHCFVFNVPRYAAGLRVAPRAVSDDGLLDWVAFQRPGRGALVRYAMAVWRGTHL